MKKSEIELKAEELAKKYKVPQVHIFIGEDEKGEQIVGYMKEPSYIQKLVALDKMATTGPFMAGDELREAITLREESDPRTFDPNPECDKYRLGMTSACITILEVYQNSYKKK